MTGASDDKSLITFARLFRATRKHAAGAADAEPLESEPNNGEYVARHMTYADAEHDVFSEATVGLYRSSNGAARLVQGVHSLLLYGVQNGHMVKRVIQGELA